MHVSIWDRVIELCTSGYVMGKKSRSVVAADAPPSPTKPAAAEKVPPSPTKPAEKPAPKAEKVAAAATPERAATPFYQRLLPEGGLLPWWVVLVFSVYALLQLGLTLEHPCSVLGVWTGMKRQQVLKAYRSLSMCTHPDKLVGYADDDVLRGNMLFKRASSARDQMLAQLRDEASRLSEGAADGEEGPAATASCSTQLDAAIFEGLSYFLGSAVETGFVAMLQSTGQFFWDLVTFQFELQTTVSLALLLLTVFRMLQGLLHYLYTAGPLSTLIAMFTTVVIGPLPTVYRALVLPALRVLTFARAELLPFLSGRDEEEEGAAGAHADDTDVSMFTQPMPSEPTDAYHRPPRDGPPQ